MTRSRATPLPRNVRLLMGMRTARSLGQGAMVAAFALYLHAMGWTGTAIGAVLMGGLLVGSVLTMAVGPLSDRGRRRAFLIGYDLLQIVAALVAMFTVTPWLLVAAAIFGGFGRGANGAAGPFSPVEQAWMSIELPAERRSSVFSRNMALGFSGMAAGALLAALPAWIMGHALDVQSYRLLFLLPLLSSLVSLALLLAAREPRMPPAVKQTEAQAGDRRREENRLIGRLALVNVLNGLAIGLTGPLIAYWFAVKFHRDLSVIAPGLALGFVLGAFGAMLASRLARRRGVVHTVVTLRGTGLLLLAAMPLVPWFWVAMALYVLRGACNRGTIGVRQALTVGLTGAERRGLVSSVQNISLQIPRAIGPVLGGALFHAGYLTIPFLIGAVLQGLYLLLYVRFFGKHPAARAGIVRAS
ncbi:MFS transporter [Oleiagrimonas citrea]|uniref:MFS transporter n=1 Tax=Oleiagrimonas citrea TaxID=1665687 RepID=A0A846ZJ94_9GAMM|nr:MFS transporter [Oleiagrimonas citrea]NKZ38264.1 MFS transporter [Oleiagrimonas citrea]